jgi:hypothetical protein
VVSVNFDEVSLPLLYASREASAAKRRPSCAAPKTEGGEWVAPEPFAAFYVLSAESKDEAEMWAATLRPAMRFQGKTIAITSAEAAAKHAQQLLDKRKEEERNRCVVGERDGSLDALLALVQQVFLDSSVYALNPGP